MWRSCDFHLFFGLCSVSSDFRFLIVRLNYTNEEWRILRICKSYPFRSPMLTIPQVVFQKDLITPSAEVWCKVRWKVPWKVRYFLTINTEFCEKFGEKHREKYRTFRLTHEFKKCLFVTLFMKHYCIYIHIAFFDLSRK